jgi:aminopeptidase-like protein
MSLLGEFDRGDQAKIGEQLHRYAAELFPICRSITGDGIRQTLGQINQRIPLQFSEVPTGTEVFDWTVPKEWNIRDAYIKDASGRRVVDFRRSNLHVVSYSVPVRATMSLSELKQHLFTLPEHPDWIPYRTSYYKESWGICLAHNQLLELADGDYEVCIDSTLADGHLTYGECYLPGRSEEEVLISTHACHPSLANDNLSGLAVATALAEFLAGRDLRFSYRFLFVPGTIGAIAWLARNREKTQHIRHGLVLTGIGDAGAFHYKKSRRGDAEIDQAVAHALRHHGESSHVLDFSPYGYDERQYCSPGFNLPVGCLMRSVWGTFPEYHTSADNLDFIHPSQLASSFRLCAATLDVLEGNGRYQNQNPFCEPQLGKRNLYRSGGGEAIGEEINARLWVLNFSDGDHSLLDIADRSGLPFASIRNAADVLRQSGLLVALPDASEQTSNSPDAKRAATRRPRVTGAAAPD